jgi:hypothetical protein
LSSADLRRRVVRAWRRVMEIAFMGSRSLLEAGVTRRATPYNENCGPGPVVTGGRRNSEMVASKPDLCVAFHRSIETSKGTKDCVKRALAAGIAVYLVEDSGVFRGG